MLSYQRDKYFTIKVTNFRVVEDYAEIHQILFDYEQEKIDRNKNNSKKMENPYSYINIKDTDMMLLIVDYYISVNDPENFKDDTLRVMIQVPRIVDKYYYRIGGNYFSAIYQIVDGSTYNNTTSNSKKQSVTFKTVFMPTRIYRNIYDSEDDNGNPIKYTIYASNIFKKNVPAVEYFLAKFGLYGALEFMGLFNGCITIGSTINYDFELEDRYYFTVNDIVISAAKSIFDQSPIVQCMVMTIVRNISTSKVYDKNKPTYSDILTTEYWLKSLAIRFNSKPTVEKGLSILDSLESIYDIDTKNSLRLSEYNKHDIYTILRWIIREFDNLRLKDNADVSTKKVRRAEYIASIYATKVSKAIYRISDQQRKITVENIKRYIRVEPDFLINMIVKDKLVSFRNTVNDNDAFTALKFSFKGRSGLGEKDNSTIPDSYRQLHPSSLGNIDPDTSSASDPGLTGIICPMAKLYNGSFATPDYNEDGDWDTTFNEIVDNYYNLKSKKQVIMFQDQFDDIFADTNKKVDKEQIDILDYCMEQQVNALAAMNIVDRTTEYGTATEVSPNSFIIWED